MALILKQMIASRRSGPVVVFKMHELQSPDQMTHVIIPLLNIDLRTGSTCNGKKCLSEAMTFVFTAAFTSP
jgi:hypothetical protein